MVLRRLERRSRLGLAGPNSVARAAIREWRQWRNGLTEGGSLVWEKGKPVLGTIALLCGGHLDDELPVLGLPITGMPSRLGRFIALWLSLIAPNAPGAGSGPQPQKRWQSLLAFRSEACAAWTN